MQYEFDINNQDYIWLSNLIKEKTINISKDKLDMLSQKYNLDSKKNNNKISLIHSILLKWEKYFSKHKEFKNLYEEVHGVSIINNIDSDNESDSDSYQSITV